MKRILIILIFLCSCLQAECQNTGYLGKHIIVKTDVINGLKRSFQNLELEVITSRSIAVTASVRRFSQPGMSDQLKRVSRIQTSENFYDYYNEYMEISSSDTEGQMATIGGKLYFNRIVPAPLGFYMHAEIGFGTAEYKFDTHLTYKPVYNDSGPNRPEPYSEGVQNKFKFYTVSFPSFGYQKILFKRVVLDSKVSLEFYADDLSEAFTKRYLLTQKSLISNPNTKYSESFLSSNITSFRRGNTTVGPAAYVKIGLLLF